MADSDLVLGLDIGTTNIKCLALSAAGKVIAQGSQPTPLSHPRPDWTDFDPQGIWEAACTTIRQVVSQLEHRDAVKGIAVSSLAESQVAISSAGQPLAPAIAWFDLRTISEFHWLRDQVGYDRLFAVSGLIPDSMFGLCKILWLKRHLPDAYAQARSFLSFADYIAFCLSGVAATDPSLACRTLAYDLRRGDWSSEILASVDLTPDFFPPIERSGTALGCITAEAATKTGLPRETTVSVGVHDHISGAFAAGGLAPGVLLDSIGTSESLNTVLRQPVFAQEIAEHGLVQGAVWIDQPLNYLSGGIFTAGSAIDWFRRELGGNEDLGRLIAEASQVDGAVPLFLPHLVRSLTPFPDAEASGAFIGLRATTTRAALFRAVLEGLAFEARLIAETMVSIGGLTPFERIVTIGTALQNRLLAQIKADVFQRSLEINPVRETVSLGAALLAGIGCGLFPSAAAAAAAAKQDSIFVRPDAERSQRLQEQYVEVYRDLFQTLRHTNHRLHSLAQRHRERTTAV